MGIDFTMHCTEVGDVTSQCCVYILLFLLFSNDHRTRLVDNGESYLRTRGSAANYAYPLIRFVRRECA